jgi:hypothetical protein
VSEQGCRGLSKADWREETEVELRRWTDMQRTTWLARGAARPWAAAGGR